jgi:hypothetical protein
MELTFNSNDEHRKHIFRAPPDARRFSAVARNCDQHPAGVCQPEPPQTTSRLPRRAGPGISLTALILAARKGRVPSLTKLR